MGRPRVAVLEVADLKGMPPQLRPGVINFVLNDIGFRDKTPLGLRLVQNKALTQFKQVLSIPAIVVHKSLFVAILSGHSLGIATCEKPELLRESDFGSLILRNCHLSSLFPSACSYRLQHHHDSAPFWVGCAWNQEFGVSRAAGQRPASSVESWCVYFVLNSAGFS